MDLNSMNEEWFLLELEADAVDASALIEAFGRLVEAGREQEADEWAQMLFQKLVDA